MNNFSFTTSSCKPLNLQLSKEENEDHKNKGELFLNEGQIKKILVLLEQESALNDSQILLIENFFKQENFSNFLNIHKDHKILHLRKNQTKLPIPLEITKDNHIIIPLKKWGKTFLNGQFKRVKTGIFVSKNEVSLLAHSTQNLLTKEVEDFSNSEIRILEKISLFLDKNPKMPGLLRFFSKMDYEKKSVEETEREHQPTGYQDIEDDREGSYESSISKQNDYEDEIKIKSPILSKNKRSIATKLYNLGNLETNLTNMAIKERLNATYQILFGLNILHHLGIFHSDLKLDNIFLGSDPETNALEAVIGDFGFSCDLTLESDRFYKNGHKSWLAPELKKGVLLGQKLSGKAINEKILACDVFAMGLILEKVFFGFKNDLLNQLIEKMKAEDPNLRPSAKCVFQTYCQILKTLSKR